MNNKRTYYTKDQCEAKGLAEITIFDDTATNRVIMRPATREAVYFMWAKLFVVAKDLDTLGEEVVDGVQMHGFQIDCPSAEALRSYVARQGFTTLVVQF